MTTKNVLILSSAILLATLILGLTYYAVSINKQQSIEKQQRLELEYERQKQADDELKKEEVRLALDACITDAKESHSDQWYSECKTRGKLTSRCQELEDEYVKENKKPDIFYRIMKQIECTCSLPLEIADRIDEKLENDKAGCFKRYPQL